MPCSVRPCRRRFTSAPHFIRAPNVKAVLTMLRAVPCFRLVDVYGARQNIEQPTHANEEADYSVFIFAKAVPRLHRVLVRSAVRLLKKAVKKSKSLARTHNPTANSPSECRLQFERRLMKSAAQPAFEEFAFLLIVLEHDSSMVKIAHSRSIA